MSTSYRSVKSVQEMLQRSGKLEVTVRRYGLDETRQRDVRSLMDEVAALGTSMYKIEDRDVLRAILDFWAAQLRIARMPSAEPALTPQLEPFRGSLPSSGALQPITREEFIRLVQRRELISKVLLEGADLSGFKFGKIDLMDSRLENCNLRGASFDRDSRLIYMAFVNCDLRDVVALRAMAMRSMFEKPKLQGAFFRDSDFTGCLMSGTQMDHHTNFMHCDFTSAKLAEVKADGAIFADANLTMIDLSGASLRNCDLSSAQLIRANLAGAVFDGAILSNAVLLAADLDNASFMGATLTGASFEYAKNAQRARFDDDNWKSARFDEQMEELWHARTAADAAGAEGATPIIPITKTGTSGQ